MAADILLTEADNVVGVSVRQSLERHGLRVCTASDRTKGGDADFKVPPSRDRLNFVKGVAAALEECGAKYVLPIFYPGTLSSLRGMLPRDVTVMADSDERLRILDDKVSCCALASSIGIPQPNIYPDPDSIPSFPVVFKRAGGHGGDSVYFPSDRKSLDNLMRNSLPGTYLVTEDVEGGDEVSVDVLIWPGFCAAASYKVLEPVGRKGVSTRRVGIVAPEAEGYARRLLRSAGYRGVAGLDFIVKEGRTYFLECNPRFTGGLSSAIAGGFDIPWLLWRLTRGESVPEPVFTPGIETGI